MYIVVKLSGKGTGRADYCTVTKFDSLSQATEYVIANTHPEQKYWEVASIVESGDKFETDCDSLL